MIKYFAKAFKITNDNIILATPLVLFLFLLSIYLGVSKSAPSNLSSAVLLLVTIIFMLSAFCAGWFYMVKKAVELDKRDFIIDEDKAKASFSLIKEFPVGIGEYFIPFLGAMLFYGVLFLTISFIGGWLGLHFIGKPAITLIQLKAAMESAVAMKALISTLSNDQLANLNAWNFLIMGLMALCSFVTMFWAVHIVSKTKNPFKAFFQSVGFTFKHFLSALIIFMYISLINFAVSLLNAVAMVNQIVYFISMLVYFYFVVYVVVLVFLYYDRENDKQDGQKIEYNCPEGDCNSGADSIGQDESGNSDSEGN